MLVNSKEMLKRAKLGGFGIPATDVFNLESLRGVLSAAKESDCPLIIAIAQVHLEKISICEAVNLTKFYANQMKQDIVLHLDHGFDIEVVKAAIDAGFTSVMYDGSSLPFEENVSNTKIIVEYARKHNVTVEGEIGHVGSNSGDSGETKCNPQEDSTMLTTVTEALDFYDQTGVDSLAVSIGTAHGNYTGTPKLDFKRLTEINNALEIPLVLHGGSGTGEANLQKAVGLGISKVNIYTDLINAANKTYQDNKNDVNYFDINVLAEEAIKNELLRYYRVFMTNKYKNK